MIKHGGFFWPDDVGEQWQHAQRHVRSIEYAIERCRQRRTAVQAGGNVGLWPCRLGMVFERVFTFEPDPVSRECLEANAAGVKSGAIVVSPQALGTGPGVMGLKHKSLGSHKIIEDGAGVEVIALDSLGLADVDYLQLDIEGYEWHALTGAKDTIIRCHPLIQVELRGFTEKYGKKDSDVWELLESFGYRLISQQPGSDFVFEFQR